MSAEQATISLGRTEADPRDLFDRPVAVTLFGDYAATRKGEELTTLRHLAGRIASTTASTKAQLPWLKLARFGESRTEKGSLRHDANVLSISGIEADYDGERMSFEEAVEVATKADLLCLIYTSPSHTTARPRWRVLCPISQELPPDQRSHLLGRLNGLFAGVFSGESWTLSQAYYFGSVASNPDHRVELVDGTPIDLLDELDETWRGKPNTLSAKAPDGAPRQGPVDEPALLDEIRSGAAYHAASVRLLGRWARDGIPYMEARQRLRTAMEEVGPADRDHRWQNRYADIDRCLDGIYGKEAAAKDRGERPAAPPQRGRHRPSTPAALSDQEWPEPIDFLADDELTGAPELRPEHLPETLYPFVHDTAARMGVDPAGVALAALVTCAAAVSDRWCIQPKRFDDTWTENPRLWGGLVGDPSILKSPVIAACTKPIDRLEAEARERFSQAMVAYLAALEAWKAAKKSGKGEPGEEPRRPRLDRYLVEGTTVEALSEALRDDSDARQRAPAGKILVRQDEMSEWLASFDRYRSGGTGSSDRGAYLRLYNGGRYTIDRILRGSFAIPNWSACFIGGIQPGPIQKVAQNAEEDGLLQRFVFCVPAAQGKGEDRQPDRKALEGYESLVRRLAALHPPRPQFGSSFGPVVLHADAHLYREESNELARALAAMPDTSGRLKAAFGKWPGLWARIALLFHLIEQASPVEEGESRPVVQVLTAETARRASAYLEEVLLPHLLRADAVMYTTRQTGHARWIAGFILAKRQERVAMRDIVQAYGALRAPERRRELLDVMEGLVSMGWVRPEERQDPTRPPSAWHVNPALLTRFAERGEAERLRRKELREEVGEIIRSRRRA
ncbi:YfjI family protein [Roseomonas populi]|uniref:YfjI family protein n=1 Tax=Roseomonas populi TaxID=3121582 RepID=A0ABT1XAZ6_9PROT|nr:YfjI family protein [Roseomonas pecuniae]MCR0985283.1 YfjI family protein [Roseomonas pecuniae]